MIEIRLGVENTDFAVVHELLANTYWSPGIARDKVERAATHSSMVINAYQDGKQVGYARVVSDRATFAWVADVVVADEAQGHGIGKLMMKTAVEDSEHQGLRRWVLATKDAHSLYEKFGFELVPNPERWMIRLQTPWP